MSTKSEEVPGNNSTTASGTTESGTNESGTNDESGNAATGSTTPPRISETRALAGADPVPLEYTELDGGLGRTVFYRPDRYQKSDLGAIKVSVAFLHGGQQQRCELYDVSQNGAAFEWESDVDLELGDTIDDLRIQFDEFEAYRGRVRVSSVRKLGAKSVVGVSLLDTLMNIDDVLHLKDVKAWERESNAEGVRRQTAPWRVPGHSSFKALVSELRLLLEDGKARLNELEAALPVHIAQGDPGSPAGQALSDQLGKSFCADVIEISAEIDAQTRRASPGELQALREFSLRQVHPLLMQSPVMHRARHKPLGYPGDYELMNGLYTNHFSGTTLFARAVNLAFASMPPAEAIRTRKDLIKREISKAIEVAKPGRPVRVLSIAAGPAEEIYELLSELKVLPGPVEFVLFEQDRGALAFSYRRLNHLVKTKWGDQVKLTLFHDSIKRLLLGQTVFANSGTCDLVYACGLCDYLQRHTWIRLAKILYGAVAPGGRLLIGNMVPSNPSKWVMEMHLDWVLVYRQQQELVELANAAADGTTQVLEEATGVNPFVEVTKD